MNTSPHVLSLGPGVMLPTLTEEGGGWGSSDLGCHTVPHVTSEPQIHADKHPRTSVRTGLLIGKWRCWNTVAIFLFEKTRAYSRYKDKSRLQIIEVLLFGKWGLRCSPWPSFSQAPLSLSRPCPWACPPQAHFQQKSCRVDLARSPTLDIWCHLARSLVRYHAPGDLPSAKILLGWFTESPLYPDPHVSCY